MSDVGPDPFASTPRGHAEHITHFRPRLRHTVSHSSLVWHEQLALCTAQL
jgi:hypothetical protein